MFTKITDKRFKGETQVDPRDYYGIPPKTILVTTTMYPSMDGVFTPITELHAGLAMQTVGKARALGYDILVVDGGSDPGWRQRIKDLGAILVDEDTKDITGAHFMGKSRRQGFIAAANYGTHEFMSWLEPEKHTYVHRSELCGTVSPVTMSVVPIAYDDADATIPRRATLTDYPEQQQHEEYTGNITVQNRVQWFADQQGLEMRIPYLDVLVGPKQWKKDTFTDLLLNYPGVIKYQDIAGQVIGHNHDQWEATIIPFHIGLVNGKDVRSVKVPFLYPPNQREFEEGNPDLDDKRVDQLYVLTKGYSGLFKNWELNPWAHAKIGDPDIGDDI